MSVSRMKRAERAQMRVLFTVPFFAPGVARLPIEFDDSGRVDTACTNGQKIVWGTKFFDSLTDAQLVTVLCHEVAHCLLGHSWRAPSGCDWTQWNVACDHAVNLMLKEFSKSVTDKRLADPFPFPDPPEAYCANPAFTNMAEEKIYACLTQGGGGGGGGGQGLQGGQGGQSGQGQGKGKGKGPGCNTPTPSPGSMPSFGQFDKPQTAADPAQQKTLANSWENTLQQSVGMAKGRGDLPGGMDRFVDEYLNPKVPWYELVRNWLREQAADDWNWMKPNTFYDESGFILPSLDNDRIGAIVFGKDTSLSIDHEVLARFVGEQQNCLDDLKPSKLIDICCDSSIHRVKEYTLGDTIDRSAPGGGGTSFVPVFEYCEDKLTVAPKCLVYLTDMDGQFPAKGPAYPVLWVNYGRPGTKAPFGEVIDIER